MATPILRLAKRAVVWSGRAPQLARVLRRVGAHRTAARLHDEPPDPVVVVSLPARLGSPGRQLRMHSVNGRDQVARALAAEGWNGFERPLPSAVAALVRRWPGVLFDVGANTGLYSLIATAADESASAIAFEPVPEIVSLLRANLVLNDCGGRVLVDDVAIGDVSGSATLHLPPPQRDGTIETSASLEPDFKPEIDRTFEVRTSTLDDAWRHHGRPFVMMVKVDVEGSEARVLAGARQLIDACRPVISVEVLERVDHTALDAIRATIGYTVILLRGDEALVGRPEVAADPSAPNQLLVPPERLDAVLEALEGIGVHVSDVR